jgi:hypothetical protein
MNVITHNHPRVNNQAFLFNAKVQAVYNDIAISRAGKNINPIYHCEG